MVKHAQTRAELFEYVGPLFGVKCLKSMETLKIYLFPPLEFTYLDHDSLDKRNIYLFKVTNKNIRKRCEICK